MLSQSAHPQLAMLAALVYVAMAVLLVLAWKRQASTRRRAECWWMLAMLELFFAVDAWVGIRLAVTDAGREFFAREGWYQRRVPFQVALVVAALFISVMGTRRVLRSLRDASAAFRASVAGSGILLAMFLLSSISLHELQGTALAILGRSAGGGLLVWGAWQGIRRQL